MPITSTVTNQGEDVALLAAGGTLSAVTNDALGFSRRTSPSIGFFEHPGPCLQTP